MGNGGKWERRICQVVCYRFLCCLSFVLLLLSRSRERSIPALIKPKSAEGFAPRIQGFAVLVVLKHDLTRARGGARIQHGDCHPLWTPPATPFLSLLEVDFAPAASRGRAVTPRALCLLVRRAPERLPAAAGTLRSFAVGWLFCLPLEGKVARRKP